MVSLGELINNQNPQLTLLIVGQIVYVYYWAFEYNVFFWKGWLSIVSYTFHAFYKGLEWCYNPVDMTLFPSPSGGHIDSVPLYWYPA